MGLLKTVRRGLSDPSVKRSVLRILRENVLCSMATVGPRNRAHINTAYFCFSPALELYFLSDPESNHCRHLRTNRSMAVTVFGSTQVWGRPDRGLQLFGTCAEAAGCHREEAERMYAGRFPAYGRAMKAEGPPSREAAFLRSFHFYRFVPRDVKVLDERVFGGGVFVRASVPRANRQGGRLA